MLRGWSRTRLAIAIAVASCGGAFTTAPDDAGHPTNLDGSLDAPIADVATEDVRVRRDGASRDAASEDVTTVDSSPEPKDGSPVDHDGGPIQDAEPEVGSEASSCSHPCPSGFECLATKCVDRAAPHFSAMTAQPPDSNWSYGYEASLGGTFMTYTHPWKAGVAIDIWTYMMTSTLEPSVFHNSGLVTETYGGMTLTAGLLGLFPGAASEASVVRWTAPIAGNYTIAATFTGISTPPTLASVGVFIKGAYIAGSSKPLNMFGGVNFFVFPGTDSGAGSGAPQALLAGDAVDFYADPYMNSDDSRGGVELTATITTN
jgi:hypothetical protein